MTRKKHPIDIKDYIDNKIRCYIPIVTNEYFYSIGRWIDESDIFLNDIVLTYETIQSATYDMFKTRRIRYN